MSATAAPSRLPARAIGALGQRWKRSGFGENARMALETLRAHKMRSFLTVLGVVIGVAAQIFVSSIMVGVDANTRNMLNEWGPNTLFIDRWDPGIRTGRLSQEERQRKVLTYDDGMAVKDLCPSVVDVDVEVFQNYVNGRPRQQTARYEGHEVYGIDHSGTLPAYGAVHNAFTRQGRWFTDAENEHRIDLAVIGSDIDDAFFPAHDGIGKTILVDGVNYRVVGVLAKRKGSFFGGSFLSSDRVNKIVKVPYWSYRKHHPQDDEGFIAAMAKPGMMQAAEEEVRTVLRTRRRVPPDKGDNFGISNAAALSDQFRQIMSMIAILTFAISSIGLLVGGVGVMNIMLMSVTERTHEIGLRKAVGARRGDVIRQFLTEAVVLTGVGGIVGVLLGVVGAVGLRLAFESLPTYVPLWAVAMGVIVAMSVGLFFGMYPAVKAARLDPVEALRYE